MFIVIIVSTLLLTVILHEMGHFIEMRKRGIRVKEFQIGLKVKFLTFRFTLKKFPGTTFFVSPLLISAGVVPESEDFKKMESSSYNDQCAIYGAGIIMNFLLSFALVIPFVLLKFYLIHFLKDIPIHASQLVSLGLIISSVVAACIFFYRIRYWFSRILILPLGLITFGFGIYLCSKMSLKDVKGFADTYSVLKGSEKNIESTTSYDTGKNPAEQSVVEKEVIVKKGMVAILIGIAISVLLAISNMLILYPLDGGRIFLVFLNKHFKIAEKIKNAYQIISMIIVLILVFYPLLIDVYELIRKLFHSLFG